MTLADLGADVTEVEDLAAGDDTGQGSPRYGPVCP